MPSLTFVLPHWLYWAGLILFPLAAMFIVRRRPRNEAAGGLSVSLAYLLWLCAGFVGIHRFYVRSILGIAYIPLFVGILFGNMKGREARNAVSQSRNEIMIADFDVERFQKAVTEGLDGAVAKLAKAEQALIAAKDNMDAASSGFGFWMTVSGSFAAAIGLFLLVDAFLLPRLVRQCKENEVPEQPLPGLEPLGGAEHPVERSGVGEDPTLKVHSRFTNFIDAINGWVGEFVCYWAVIAVFTYYYEVLARYVFNSPTNWAHEGMFLMFGMQYLLSAGYAMREDAHVRVDVIYLLLSERAKVITDIVTSVFMFIFSGTLLVTGMIFLMDSISVWEVSFTEWAIQYWPVKITIALGAFLLIAQGFAKLIKDFILLTNGRA